MTGPAEAFDDLTSHGDAFDLDALRDLRGELDGLRLDALEHLAATRLAWFVRCTWRIVEPADPLVWSWHMDTICQALERTLREGGDLVICIPPGYAKSLLVSVFLAAFAWLDDPADRLLYLSGSESIAKRDSRKAREIVKSGFYRRLVARRLLILRSALDRGEEPKIGAYARLLGRSKPEPWTLAKDQAERVNFATELGGQRCAFPFGAHITGERGRVLVVDDPVDAKNVVILPVARQAEVMADVVLVYDQVLRSRLSPFRNARIVIAQRLHEDDLPGVLIRRGWPCIVVAERFDPDDQNIHPDDPRTTLGELAAPLIYDQAESDKRARALGARHASAQLDQRPAPSSGGMFDAALEAVDWYMDNPFEIAHRQGFATALSVDATFGSKGATASAVAIQAWAWERAHRWLLWEDCDRMTWHETRAAVRKAFKVWPKSRRVIIEKKANGAALLEDLADDVPNLEAFDPDAGKEGRASILVSACEAGQIHAPHPDNRWVHKVDVPFRDVVTLVPDAERRGEAWPAGVVEASDGTCRVPWPVLWRGELARFPGGRKDDRVDASSCAAIKLGEGGGENARDRIVRQFAVLSAGRPGAKDRLFRSS